MTRAGVFFVCVGGRANATRRADQRGTDAFFFRRTMHVGTRELSRGGFILLPRRREQGLYLC